MIKRNCLVHEPGIAIEALASALDPERKPPFKGDILDLLEWATKDVLEMRQQLETERMRLAACGVVALSNTPESAATARGMMPEYRSASCDDVARAVDREIELRQQLAERNAEIKRINYALDDYRVDLIITAAEAITELRQQLAIGKQMLGNAMAELGRQREQLSDSQKREVMLRDAVAYGVDNSDFDGETFDNKLREALAATADLENVRLCEKEPCRDDGRCQYAIDHGAEGMGHCPEGKCCMPRYSPKGLK